MIEETEMPISDNDLQVLEEWLDGELPEGQTESLRRRLSLEPELSQAMNRLRDERQLRSRLFTLLEPGENEIEVQIGHLRREVRREELWASRVRGLKKLTSLAAAIVLVFMAGWISRERLSITSPQESKVIVQDPIRFRSDSTGSNTVLAGMQTASSDPNYLRFVNPVRHGTDLSSMPVAARVDNNRQVYPVVLQDPSMQLVVPQGNDLRIVVRLPNEMFNRTQPQAQQAPREGILIQNVRPRGQ